MTIKLNKFIKFLIILRLYVFIKKLEKNCCNWRESYGKRTRKRQHLVSINLFWESGLIVGILGTFITFYINIEIYRF